MVYGFFILIFEFIYPTEQKVGKENAEERKESLLWRILSKPNLRHKITKEMEKRGELY